MTELILPVVKLDAEVAGMHLSRQLFFKILAEIEIVETKRQKLFFDQTQIHQSQKIITRSKYHCPLSRY